MALSENIDAYDCTYNSVIGPYGSFAHPVFADRGGLSNSACCGEKMAEIIPGVVEASHEKHIPVVEIDGSRICISVGSVEHPMVEEHSILWIYLKTDRGAYRKHLNPGDKPVACFNLYDEKPIAAYAYCNLHGLWKFDIK